MSEEKSLKISEKSLKLFLPRFLFFWGNFSTWSDDYC